eukprot:jgi/Bigna1/87970/estExt_fgenesh1_pg.C_260131
MRKSFNRNRRHKKKAKEAEPQPVPENEADAEEGEPEKKIVELSPEELDREYETTYEAKDPNVPPNICHFHHKEKEYKLYKPKNVAAQMHMCVHFKMMGNLILKDGEEAKEQNIKDPVEEEKVVKLSTANQSQFDDIEAKFAAIDANLEFAASEEKKEEGKDEEEEKKEDDESKEEEKEEEGKKESDDIYSKNQFNFSDRASQTVSFPSRTKEVATKMPPAVKFCKSVFQWTIYDRYVKWAKEIVAARHAAEKKGSRDKKKKNTQTVLTYNGSDESIERDRILNNPRAKILADMLDRIVVQNVKNSSFMKFKYTTESDEKDHRGEHKKTGKGTFQHLFSCSFHEAKGKTVTALCWNRKYMDMFAVGYGSYNFMPKNQKGLICVFSMKNTSYPIFVFRTHSGVMSIDFHPIYPNLLACGMYDGTVSVYDMTSKTGKPLFFVDDPRKKHWEPVWQVRWKNTVPGKPNVFTSISSDGRIVDWVMAKTELENVEVMQIKAKEKLEGEDNDDDEETNPALAGGQCFDVNDSGDLYVVGTDEGALRTYSKQYDTECLEKFKGHHSQVYACKWNKYNTNVFLSSSHDWCVKVWHRSCFEPIMTFDLGSPVGDVQWAPYSSTVFGCVTEDNWLRLYDLNVNKHEPVGEMQITRKYKKKPPNLTHLAFNPREPIVLVGDERGVVQIYKLSPNLRVMTASAIENLEPETEMKKIKDVLILDGKVNKVFRRSDVGKKEPQKADEEE